MNRKGFLNKIMCLFLMIVFLLPTGTIVNAFSTSVDINRYEMDEEQLTMQNISLLSMVMLNLIEKWQ